MCKDYLHDDSPNNPNVTKKTRLLVPLHFSFILSCLLSEETERKQRKIEKERARRIKVNYRDMFEKKEKKKEEVQKKSTGREEKIKDGGRGRKRDVGGRFDTMRRVFRATRRQTRLSQKEFAARRIVVSSRAENGCEERKLKFR